MTEKIYMLCKELYRDSYPVQRSIREIKTTIF